jgi:hypothetical protein
LNIFHQRSLRFCIVTLDIVLKTISIGVLFTKVVIKTVSYYQMPSFMDINGCQTKNKKGIICKVGKSKTWTYKWFDRGESGEAADINVCLSESNFHKANCVSIICRVTPTQLTRLQKKKKRNIIYILRYRGIKINTYCDCAVWHLSQRPALNSHRYWKGTKLIYVRNILHKSRHNLYNNDLIFYAFPEVNRGIIVRAKSE